MTDIEFNLMAISKKHSEKRMPVIDNRIKTFNIKDGMTVVDYGCGPGMYTVLLSRAVGENGQVFAVDVLKIAQKTIEKVILKNKLVNVTFFLAENYKCKINNNCADMVLALDIIHGIENPNDFLAELHRICRDNGILIIDDGHQQRSKTKEFLKNSKKWEITEETADVIKCKKK